MIATRRKILVADDEDAIQRVVARGLGTRAYELLQAKDGREALELACERAPDLIVLDIHMPQKSGWEVLRELRGNFKTRSIPIIMLTNQKAVKDRVNGLELGADDYIGKPFSIEELKARVAGVLRRTQLDLCSNPLTRLPGSPAIEAEVCRRIEAALPFAFLYCDIDHFKPYNDLYGYARGDEVIQETAYILLESLEKTETLGAFVGHIGGDDFVVVTRPDDAPPMAQAITSLFDERRARFFNAEDFQRGYIETKNRQDIAQRFPLLTLSVGIATTQNRSLRHYAKVVEIAAEMKHFLKSDPARRLSRFAFDRRRDS
ncbi:MAG: response regulator [Elusimicrobia bacterium]|nr:response regulator [Elusimicrobiota bacterium]